MAISTSPKRRTRSRKPNRDVNYSRLCSAVNASYRALKPFRDSRSKAVREYAGNHYGNRAADDRIPLNLLSMYVQVMTRLLVAKMPRVLLTTFDKKMKANVAGAQDWLNEKLVDMEFDETLERWVVDSMFSIGVLKVALSTPGDVVTENWGMESGEPFCEVVDLDDFVFDVKNARRFSQATFIGHQVLIPRDVLAEDEKIPADVRKKFMDKDRDCEYQTDGPIDADRRVEKLQQGDEGNSPDHDTEFEEYIRCWEIYLPRRRIVCLFLASEMEAITGVQADDQGKTCEPLKVVPWVGPPCGPYHVLPLGVIPDNAMPKSPIQDLMDLHLAFNKLFRKAIRQAERQKTVYAVKGAADRDGNRIVECPDGVAITVDDPSNMAPMNFPGADAGLVQFSMMLKDLFDFMAGNLSMKLGSAPSAPTATQEKILAAGNSAQMDDMMQRVLRCTQHVLRALLWYYWHDPFKTMRSELSLPGMPEVSTVRLVKPEDREKGSYSDMRLRIDPYSMQPQTPQSRMQAIMSVIQGVFLPLAGIALKQGVNLDLQKVFALLSEYMDQPDLADVFSIQDPPVEAGAMGDSESTSAKPAATERTYNRVSSSEKTQGGAANERVAAMGAAENGQAGY